MKTLRDKLSEIFTGEKAPRVITEQSSVNDIAIEYPNLFQFMDRKYGVRIGLDDKQLSLQELVAKYGLPPAQVVFMEVQLSDKTDRVSEVSALEAKQIIQTEKDVAILDVREEWEVKISKLNDSQVLNASLLDEILSDWPKDKTILLYCHHGVRSLDAAHFLADRGFTHVFSIRGGIDSWSLNVDPAVARYHGNYC